MKITVSQIRNSRIKEVISNICFNSQPQNTKNIWFAPKIQINISLLFPLWPAPRADPEGPTTGSRPQKRHSPASRTVHSGWSALDEETSTQTSEYEKRQTAMQKVFRVFADVKNGICSSETKRLSEINLHLLHIRLQDRAAAVCGQDTSVSTDAGSFLPWLTVESLLESCSCRTWAWRRRTGEDDLKATSSTLQCKAL